MSTTKPRFSLKKKLVILIVSIIVAISAISGLFCYKGLSDITRTMYTSRSKELSATAAAMVDPHRVKNIRDQVMEIYRATEDRVSTEDWGSPEFDAYLEKYAAIAESEDYRILQEQLRTIQDNNNLECAYMVCFDIETNATIYLVDGTYDEEYCPPGCFDPIMYEVDYEAMRHPENGIAPDVTNTKEYGWVVAAGSPIFCDGELITFAAVDISMNDMVNQRNRFLMIACAALLALAVVFIVIGIMLVDRTIIRPINKLSDTSEKYWSSEASSIHNEFSQLQIHTGDEIETLSNSMKQMEQNINDHINKILETTQTLISTREHADEMDRAANIDALTKVRNKRAYDIEIERINQEIKAGNTAFGLGMIDLNFLKKTNDTYGHEAGDEALRILCRTICRIFRHSPIFRIGGDEFVVVLENHDYEHLDELKVDFERELQNLQGNKEPWERISAAAGYALFDPETDGDLGSVFKRADQLMYERKKQMKAERVD